MIHKVKALFSSVLRNLYFSEVQNMLLRTCTVLYDQIIINFTIVFILERCVQDIPLGQVIKL